MKKVKIMLLSLALFAVVGAALAFKAKFKVEYCTTNAYWNGSAQNPLYYCSFQPAGQETTTTSCGLATVQSTTVGATGVQKVCTTDPDPSLKCTDGNPVTPGKISCPAQTTLIID
jgi:hypothetical protein